MPEGDSIHRLARKLAPVLVGREIREFSARRFLRETSRSVAHHRVTSVEARGKNLLIHLDDDRMLHVHLRMNGRIFLERPRSAFWAPLRYEPDLRIVVDGAIVVGRNLPVLRLLTDTQARRDPSLATLGPDLTTPKWDENEALSRLRALGDREIGAALLVQRATAGIGNVYKSEVLFLQAIDPIAPVSALRDDELLGLLRLASTLLQRNLGDGPRVTRPTLGGPRLWVYGRKGKPCLRCGTGVEMFIQSPLRPTGQPSAERGRSTYHCPKCQPRRTSTARDQERKP